MGVVSEDDISTVEVEGRMIEKAFIWVQICLPIIRTERQYNYHYS